MIQLSKLTDQELDELASDISSFTNSRAFGVVFAGLQAKYIQQLLQANVGDLTAASAHASMKVLEDVKGELKLFHNEIKMREKR